MKINAVKFGVGFVLVAIPLLGLTNCEKKQPVNLGSEKDSSSYQGNYPIVGTNQTLFYNNGSEIRAPAEGAAFYGQDATYVINPPSYADNADGTVSDQVTGLMWFQSPDLNNDGAIDANDKLTYAEALRYVADAEVGGYTDWRLPTIKELYSLIMFDGEDPSGIYDENNLKPFINTRYFNFAYGDENTGERLIDAQFVSATVYVDVTMGGNETVFGVNFADGRIKGYPMVSPMGEKTFYLLLVRGNENYGINNFEDNGDGTITDHSTGLMWLVEDSQSAMNWEDALTYAEELELAGYSDWRLPDAKELQSIVDYTRSPATTNSAAIDPLFSCSLITSESGANDYPFYWSSTTHANMSGFPGANACYLSFGTAWGYMFGEWIDVHGAGAQRSDPKSGSSYDYPYGHGPQGDAIRVNNYVRCVRNAD